MRAIPCRLCGYHAPGSECPHCAHRSTAPSQIEQTARPEPNKPLQILTVAVDHETALSLVELAVEEQGEFEIWVSLSPLTAQETQVIEEGTGVE